VRVLLDTQAFIALSETGLEGLSTHSRNIVADEEVDLLFSSISITEIAIKLGTGKLAITADDLMRATERLRLTLIPYETRHAMRFFELPVHHRDPFDRMLIATALVEDVAIITSDRAFSQYKGLRVIQ
jgi:PIN domain nuclease of toxin-antitoxin system